MSLENLNSFEIPPIPSRVAGSLIPVGHTEIYLERFGSGRPLLLLHGGAATLESWFGQIPVLAEDFEVIVAEARGHGRSPDVAGPINFENMAADFCGLLDELGLKEVGIVGWSDGGVTALQMAISRPDLVSGVIGFGVHGRPDGMTDDFRSEVEASTAENFPPILKDTHQALSPDGPGQWAIVFEKLRTMWLTLPSFTDEDLARVKCPVLQIVGETDIVRREESERLVTIIPNAELMVLSGASHYSPVEMPDKVNQIIKDFFHI